MKKQSLTTKDFSSFFFGSFSLDFSSEVERRNQETDNIQNLYDCSIVAKQRKKQRSIKQQVDYIVDEN